VLRPLRSGAAALEQLNGLTLPTGLLGGGLKSAELEFGELEPDPAATLVALLEGSASSLTDLNLGCGASRPSRAGDCLPMCLMPRRGAFDSAADFIHGCTF
jgi:hypothetical protein